jgi:condensin-2 complex subunit H2
LSSLVISSPLLHHYYTTTTPLHTRSLEEYLHDLVGHLPIEERQKVAADASLDFTEAALVLQNSSNIYSRKVEYLYTLVYQALNDLSGSVDVASGAGHKGRKTAGDAEIEEFHAFDPHQQFLLLDDVLPVDETDNCEKINMPESADDTTMTGANRLWTNHRTGMSASTGKQNQNQTARLSLGGDFSTTMDRSVQAMNAAAHRALIGSLDTGSLRLLDGQCDIDESGVLLMPGTASQRSTAMNFASQETMSQSHLDVHDDGDFGRGHHGDYDEGDDDGGGGFAFGDDQDKPPAPEALSETHNRVTFAETVQQPKKKRSDPWELLDPHTPDSVKARPLRIGKTIKLPPGVDELPSDCVTGARTRRVSRKKKVPLPPVLEKPSKSLATEIFKATMAARKRSHNETTVEDEYLGIDEEAASFPSLPLKGLVFGDEFAYIAKATAKRKATERREQRKEQLMMNTPSVPEEDDNDDDGGFAFGGMDDGDDGDDGDFGGAFDNDNGPVMGNTGIASMDEVYHAQDNLGTWTESLSCCVF